MVLSYTVRYALRCLVPNIFCVETSKVWDKLEQILNETWTRFFPNSFIVTVLDAIRGTFYLYTNS